MSDSSQKTVETSEVFPEKNNYEVIYGGFIKPSVPSNCPAHKLKDYGSKTSQEVVDIIDRLDFSKILK